MALSKLDSLYMAVVADHSKNPHHKVGWKMLNKSVLTIQPVVMSLISLSSLMQKTAWRISLF